MSRSSVFTGVSGRILAISWSQAGKMDKEKCQLSRCQLLIKKYFQSITDQYEDKYVVIYGPEVATLKRPHHRTGAEPPSGCRSVTKH
jgi:hypothetical protein